MVSGDDGWSIETGMAWMPRLARRSPFQKFFAFFVNIYDSATCRLASLG
jgi:hypothetical protein